MTKASGYSYYCYKQNKREVRALETIKEEVQKEEPRIVYIKKKTKNTRNQHITHLIKIKCGNIYNFNSKQERSVE